MSLISGLIIIYLRKNKTMNKELLSFVNEIAPEHSRTSCSDDHSGGNEYFNESGYPRCTRCAFLYRLKNGSWLYNAKPNAMLVFEGGEQDDE